MAESEGLQTGIQPKATTQRRSRPCFCCCVRHGDDKMDGATGLDPVDLPKACTDIWMLGIYVLFCLFMVVIGVFAISYGNPHRLTYGLDSFGNICGLNNPPMENMHFTGMELTDRPYVFYFDPFQMSESRKICVRECPDVVIHNIRDLQDFHRNQSANLCQYDFQPELIGNSNSFYTAAIAKSLCPEFPYPATVPVLKRCIPQPISPELDDEISSIYGYLNGLPTFKQILGDLAMTWKSTVALSAVAFVTSVLLLICVRWLSRGIAYVIILLALVSSIALTSFFWYIYLDLKGILDLYPPSQLLVESVWNERLFCVGSIISTVFSLVLLCVVWYIRNRVTSVMTLFYEAGIVLKSMPLIYLQPLCTYVILISFFSIWLLVMLCLATADSPESKTISIPPRFRWEVHNNKNATPPTGLPLPLTTMTVIEYTDGLWIKYLWWVYVIGLIWCSEFILACQKMVIATSVSTWYFSRGRDGLKWIVFYSIINLGRFHLGSMALGSLLITIFRFPRLFFGFLQRCLVGSKDKAFARGITNCCSSCLNCFDTWLRMCHHNAFTVIALQSRNFCTSARLALAAVVTNSLDLSPLSRIGDFILFLTKVIVASLTGVIALFIFRADERLYFYAIPILVSLLFAYYVAHCVMSVFEMTMDVLFLCFCEDYNLNATQDMPSFWGPPSLLQYMTDVATTRRKTRGMTVNSEKVQQTDATIIGEELMPMKGPNFCDRYEL